MLKRTFVATMLMLWCGALYAQDKPTIYSGVCIKPKAGMVQKEVTTFQMMSGSKFAKKISAQPTGGVSFGPQQLKYSDEQSRWAMSDVLE